MHKYTLTQKQNLWCLQAFLSAASTIRRLRLRAQRLHNINITTFAPILSTVFSILAPILRPFQVPQNTEAGDWRIENADSTTKSHCRQPVGWAWAHAVIWKNTTKLSLYPKALGFMPGVHNSMSFRKPRHLLAALLAPCTVRGHPDRR